MRRRCAAPTAPSLTAASVHLAFRCGLHNAPCSIRVGGSYGNAGRVGNPIPQSAICRVGDRDDVWQARLPLLGCYETAVDPVIDDPHTDAVSLANLFDVECTGGKRRAGNAILRVPRRAADEGRSTPHALHRESSTPIQKA